MQWDVTIRFKDGSESVFEECDEVRLGKSGVMVSGKKAGANWPAGSRALGLFEAVTVVTSPEGGEHVGD